MNLLEGKLALKRFSFDELLFGLSNGETSVDRIMMDVVLYIYIYIYAFHYVPIY